MKQRSIWWMIGGSVCLAIVGLIICVQPGRTSTDAAPSIVVAPEPTSENAPRPLPPDMSSASEVTIGKIVQEGISIECSMNRIGGGREGNKFLENDDVRFRFRVTDTASGTPVTSTYPASWLVTRQAETVTSPELANKKAQALINASVFSPADLDLNVYYVLTLNSNATITVVDPLFGYGTTKLLALIQLKSPGADWVLSTDDSKLYVSLPESHEVAVIDTMKWELLAYVEGGNCPDRIALQPDGHYLWVGGGGVGSRADDSGVTVLRTDTLEVVARIRTGRGRHDIAFSDDSRFAFVTNSQHNTVTIIDVRTLQVRADVPTGTTPVSIDFSRTAQMAYVTHAGDGTIAAVSGPQGKVVERLPAQPGLGQIKFAPNGRHGFVLNTQANLLHILDAAKSQIVQTGELRDGPDQLAFSDNLAYVRHQNSPEVLMIPLDAIGTSDQKIPLIEFPAGQAPAGRMSRLCLAPTMVQAPGASAMLVANPSDQAVYFYKEGMAAPMGTFSNYGREPIAVAVVDRSLRERSDSGIYETVARLPEPGSYDLVFFLDGPRIVHCFPVDIHPDPELQRARNAGQIDIEHSVDQPNLRVGHSETIRFKLKDRNSGTARSGLGDVQIQTFLVPGTWHDRHPAKETEPGVYAIDFVPPEAGVYYISVASEAVGLTHGNPHLLVLKASLNSTTPSTDEAERVTPLNERESNTNETTDESLE